MSQIKRHPYFYTEGPDTVETILPISADEVPEKLREWPGLKHECDLCSNQLMASWLQKSESLQGHISRTLKGWIDTCVPYSVVQFTEWTWIAFKRQGMVDETTEYGNCILVPVNEPLAALPSGFPLHKNPEIEEFVRVFRNICGSIPPTNTLWPADSPPVSLRGSQYNVSLNEWEDSLPLLFDGASNMIVVSRDGKLGRFEMEWATKPPPKLIKSSDFLQSLGNRFGGEAFESGDD